MEVNTRLQVEHPVTEATTGLDLVKLQLQVAAGRPARRGAARAARPRHRGAPERRGPRQPTSRPRPGRVALLRLPAGPGMRVDTGVREGDEIPVEFDSMIAKIVAWGRDREEARARLARALARDPGRRRGRHHQPRLPARAARPSRRRRRQLRHRLDRPRAGAAGRRSSPATRLRRADVRPPSSCTTASSPRSALNFFAVARAAGPTRRRSRPPIELRYRGTAYEFGVHRSARRLPRQDDGGAPRRPTSSSSGPTSRGVCFDRGRRHRVVSVLGGHRTASRSTGVAHRVTRDPGGVVRAPAPAVVVVVLVARRRGGRRATRLVVLEAMKMEMPVTAPFDGRVARCWSARTCRWPPAIRCSSSSPSSGRRTESRRARASRPLRGEGRRGQRRARCRRRCAPSGARCWASTSTDGAAPASWWPAYGELSRQRRRPRGAPRGRRRGAHRVRRRSAR